MKYGAVRKFVPMPIEKLDSSSLDSSMSQRGGKLHCSLTGQKLCSQVKKNADVILFTHGIIKDFVHNGSYRATTRVML